MEKLDHPVLADGAAMRQLQSFLAARLSKMVPPSDPDEWRQRAASTRKGMLGLFFRGHQEGLLHAEFPVEWTQTIQKDGYKIRKLRYEGYPGLWVPALLYEPDRLEGKTPAVLNPNGHHAGGKAMAYKQARCVNLARRGMLALNYEFLGMGELVGSGVHDMAQHLDLCGVEGVGVFHLIMKRALDILARHLHADPTRLAMTGLSGGGWQTATLSALDERVTHIVPVAGHSAVWQRKDFLCDIGDSEQVPQDFCTVADYDTLTAMFAPRPSLLIYNRDDNCCFRPERTRVSIFFPARQVYELLGAGDKLSFHVNTAPGTHNYDEDNRCQLYRFLNRHMGLDTPEEDLPCQGEILTEVETDVGLPPDNATLAELARLELVKVRQARAAREENPEAARERLTQVLKLPDYTVTGLSAGVFHLSGVWDIPAIIAEPKTAQRMEIILHDWGKPGVAAAPEAGTLWVMPDIFGTGELAFDKRYHMLVSGSGARSLGIQVAQILALAAWGAKSHGKVKLSANGMVTSVAALMAAALAPERFASLVVNGLPKTLDILVERPTPYDDSSAALFCFGLLREFDIPDLVALSVPVPLSDSGRGPLRQPGQAMA